MREKSRSGIFFEGRVRLIYEKIAQQETFGPGVQDEQEEGNWIQAQKKEKERTVTRSSQYKAVETSGEGWKSS